MTDNKNGNSKRATSLDALRGYAILTMVLSGTIAGKVLPAWMYHAQVPPPLHQFDPTIYGITWVDLVFPFFLFAMGAAFPFSIGKKLNDGKGVFKAVLDSIFRGIQLTFFAVYIQHLYPWVINEPQNLRSWLLTIFAFLLMFPMFMRIPGKLPEFIKKGIKLFAFVIGIVMLFIIPYAGGRTFDPAFSNIIILLLANMSIFGSIAYILTYKKPLARIAILPFVMAIMLGSSTEGSWNSWVYNFTPIPWMYRFEYLSYLFILIPGTIAGEYLLEWIKTPAKSYEISGERKYYPLLLLLISIALILVNLFGLFTRNLVVNLIISFSMLIAGNYLLRKPETPEMQLWKKLFSSGAYLLLLGLFFDAFEGGIRKDYATYSYYFVTSGLGFMGLIAFSIACDYYKWNKVLNFLIMPGQNPMIAYVAPNMLVMPLLSIAGLSGYLSLLDDNPWYGLLKGLIITSLVTLVSMFFTRIKWFWRT